MNIINLTGDEYSPEGLKEQFALDVLIGLTSQSKRISPKYFYNDLGSELFQKITESKDYYLTNLEHQILNNYSVTIAKKIKETTDIIDLIELGAGDGRKTTLLVNALNKEGIKINYFPIDISEKAMAQMKKFLTETEKFNITGIIAEYFHGLNYLRDRSKNPKLLLFLGSNIGNFNRAQAAGFMRKAWRTLNLNDWLLLGADLKKDINILHKAYNDSDGITRRFNLNLLNRINEELGGDFEIKSFDHYGSYNPLMGAMESYLISKKEQTVYVKELKKKFHFKSFEPIHMEYSTKYLEAELLELGISSGFKAEETYYDKKKWFSNFLFKVIKH